MPKMNATRAHLTLESLESRDVPSAATSMPVLEHVKHDVIAEQREVSDNIEIIMDLDTTEHHAGEHGGENAPTEPYDAAEHGTTDKHAKDNHGTDHGSEEHDAEHQLEEDIHAAGEVLIHIEEEKKHKEEERLHALHHLFAHGHHGEHGHIHLNHDHEHPHHKHGHADHHPHFHHPDHEDGGHGAQQIPYSALVIDVSPATAAEHAVLSAVDLAVQQHATQHGHNKNGHHAPSKKDHHQHQKKVEKPTDTQEMKKAPLQSEEHDEVAPEEAHQDQAAPILDVSQETTIAAAAIGVPVAVGAVAAQKPFSRMQRLRKWLGLGR